MQHAHAGCGAGSLGFGRWSDAVSNMHVMALTVNAGLRLRAGEMCTVLSSSPIPFFTSVVISRCSPLFFHGCYALCFRHSHYYDNCGQSSHTWSGSFRRSRNFYITDEGDKKSLRIPTGSSKTSTRTRLGAHLPELPGQARPTAIRTLTMQNRPLDQFNVALLQLQRKITSGSGLQKVGHALTWKFSKKEAESILLRIERLKSLIQMALETDHFSVTASAEVAL